jgi:hypothetical protein
MINGLRSIFARAWEGAGKKQQLHPARVNVDFGGSEGAEAPSGREH